MIYYSWYSASESIVCVYKCHGSSLWLPPLQTVDVVFMEIAAEFLHSLK